MSAAQMKFLEEQRLKKLAAAKPSIAALGASNSNIPSAKPVAAPATKPANGDVITSEPAKKTIADMWRFSEGSGTLGNYTLGRHTPSGLVIELWQEGAGSFAFRRATGAKVKYCSSYEDEPKLAAPEVADRLDSGEGTSFKAGSMGAGCWGEGEVRGRRFIFACVVKTREGMEKIELVLTREGFVFVPAEGFKSIAVRNGEFMQITKDEAKNMIKGADANLEEKGGRS